MKKLILYCLAFVMLLSGCTKIKETVDNTTPDSTEIVVESHSDDTYRTIISNSGTAVRDVFYGVFKSNEQDYYKIGRGLERVCLNHFSTSTYYLKESEHLSYRIGTEASGDYFQLLGKIENYEHSIQPYQTDVNDGVTGPHIYNTIYAVDFYQSTNDGYEFSGMGISVVILKDYTDNQTGITYTYSDATIEHFAGKAIKGIYDYYYNYSSYEEMKNIPIVIGVYLQSSSSDINSGRYIYSSYCENGVAGEKQSVNQHTYVFVSDAASNADATTYSEFVLLRSKIKEANVEAIGVVGIGQYYDGKIDSMTITINMNSKVYDEFKAICQYVCQLLNDKAFSEEFEIKVKISDQTRIQAVVIKDREKEASYYMLED